MFFISLFWILAAPAAAEDATESALRTFTATDGRAIEGELLGFRDDRVRVRRSDSKQVVTLTLSQLAPESQTEIKELMQKRRDLRDVLPANTIQVQVSRVRLRPRFGEEKFLSTEREAWAYSVTVGNRSAHEIHKLRVDYVLVGDSDRPKIAAKDYTPPLIRAKGSFTLENLKFGAFVTEKTIPLICETHLEYRTTIQNGTYTTDYKKVTNRTRMSFLKGIWLRIYDEDALMVEQIFPEGLPMMEWNAPDTNARYRDDVLYGDFLRDPSQ